MVTLCIIARDEEEMLPRCLASVAGLVEECVVVDTGSKDGTRDVARRAGARVFDEPWRDDFASARNAAFARATEPYIWWLDADDVLLPPDQERFRVLRRQLDGSANAVTMIYHYAFDDAGQPILRFRLPRLVRRAAGYRWIGRVHEYLEGPGPVRDSDVVVTHRRQRSAGDRNLRIYEAMRTAGEAFTPRDLLYYANELADHGRWDEANPLYARLASDESVWTEDRLWALGRMAEAAAQRGDRTAMREAVYRTFDLGAPRAEACCRLGWDALERGAPAEAIVWYDLATRLPRPDTGGFQLEACWTWLPHLQLAVAYARTGQLTRAAWHNEQAARWRPQDPAVLHNRRWFAQQGVNIANLPADEPGEDGAAPDGLSS
jgi:hypothetical protein